MQRIFFIFLTPLIILFSQDLKTSVPEVMGQSNNLVDEKALIVKKENKKFLEEMKNLLDAASNSGFNEKEIREITVTRNGKIINVWDFLEMTKLKQRKDEQNKKRSKPLERYLTVMDISEEMESTETRDLDDIKNKITFLGVEEK